MEDLNNVNYEKIVNNIVDFGDNYSQKLMELHTKMIIEATKGNSKAKKYMYECIRRELLILDKKFKKKELANPMIEDIYSKYWGFGILEKYTSDKTLDEIMVDGKRVSIEKSGIIYEVPERFASNLEAENIIRRVLEYGKGQDISTKNPYKLSNLLDGSRITANLSPISKHPELNIRKFDSFVPTEENLLKKTITKKMAELTNLAINGYLNIAIIGEMGSGKTVFTKWMLGKMPKGERVGILENEFELNPEKLYPNLYFILLLYSKLFIFT